MTFFTFKNKKIDFFKKMIEIKNSYDFDRWIILWSDSFNSLIKVCTKILFAVIDLSLCED